MLNSSNIIITSIRPRFCLSSITSMKLFYFSGPHYRTFNYKRFLALVLNIIKLVPRTIQRLSLDSTRVRQEPSTNHLTNNSIILSKHASFPIFLHKYRVEIMKWYSLEHIIAAQNQKQHAFLFNQFIYIYTKTHLPAVLQWSYFYFHSLWKVIILRFLSVRSSFVHSPAAK